jgi:hypothetical protein
MSTLIRQDSESGRAVKSRDGLIIAFCAVLSFSVLLSLHHLVGGPGERADNVIVVSGSY